MQLGMTLRALFFGCTILYLTATFDSISMTAGLFGLELCVFLCRLSARDAQASQPRRIADDEVDATLDGASAWLHLFSLPVVTPTRVGLALVTAQHVVRWAIVYILLGFQDALVPNGVALVGLIAALSVIFRALYKPRALFNRAQIYERAAIATYLVLGAVLIMHHVYRPQTYRVHAYDYRMGYAGIVQLCHALLLWNSRTILENEDLAAAVDPMDVLDTLNVLLWWWLWACAGHKRLVRA